MKMQSDAINRLNMRLQSIETDFSHSSIPVTLKAPSQLFMSFESKENRESLKRKATELQELPIESKQKSQIEDYDIDINESDENNFLNAVVLKRNHLNSIALEYILQGSWKERLHKAGLQKEQTSIFIIIPEPIRPIPIVILEFANIITKLHLSDITYMRGTTYIKKLIEKQHAY